MTVPVRESMCHGWLSVLALALAAASCSDQAVSPGPADTSTDAVEDTGADQADADTGPSFSEQFRECSGSDECDDNDVCHQEVCVRDRAEEATLYREEAGDYVEVGEPPDFDCWQTPTPLPSGPVETTSFGDVDLFGPASPTRNICITVYDEDLLLHWLAWLDANICGELLDVDLRDQEPFVNCFALDPCRCDDPDFTVDRGDAGESLEACYAEIGYCRAIADSDLRQRCQDNVQQRTGVEADSLIYASSISTEYEPNPDRTEGFYELDGVPTNTRLVFKASGQLTRWRDTYEFGAVIAADQVEDGRARWDTNIITDGAWRTIPLTAGVAQPTPPDRAAIAGVVRDCSEDNNRQVRGAQVGFVNDPVTIAYFNGVANDTLPQPGQAFTNSDGVYAAIALPSGPNRVSVLAQQDGEPVSAGVRDVYVTPFSVMIATFEGNWER